jgi:hypothetical protein
MTSQVALEDMLASCTLRVDTSEGPQGTAFFVAPEYAITAAHVVNGAKGTRVQLHGRLGTWIGHVHDSRPEAEAFGNSVTAPGLSPPPDVALIRLVGGAAHSCVLLGDQKMAAGMAVIARGHSRIFDGVKVMPESEYFTVSGELETSDPDYTLLKLGRGQAVKGMSGAPVLSLGTGEVIGMLRASRDLRTSLGAWVVPAAVILGIWPQEVGGGHDQFHQANGRWRWMSRAMAEHAVRSGGSPQQPAGVAIGPIYGNGPVTMFHGGHFGDVNIGGVKPANGGGDEGEPGAR